MQPPAVVEAIFRHGAMGQGVELFSRIFRETTSDRAFADLSIPATVMTTDLASRSAAPITTGPLWEALMAALAIPGLYSPWIRGEQRLVDAVSLTPVPVDAVIEAGADITVAVNLLGRETLSQWLHGGGQGPGAIGPSRPRDTVVEVLELAQLGTSARETARADVPVTPLFGPGTWRQMELGGFFFMPAKPRPKPGSRCSASLPVPLTSPSDARKCASISGEGNGLVESSWTPSVSAADAGRCPRDGLTNETFAFCLPMRWHSPYDGSQNRRNSHPRIAARPELPGTDTSDGLRVNRRQFYEFRSPLPSPPRWTSLRLEQHSRFTKVGSIKPFRERTIDASEERVIPSVLTSSPPQTLQTERTSKLERPRPLIASDVQSSVKMLFC